MSLGASSPLPRTTRRSHRLHARHGIQISLSETQRLSKMVLSTRFLANAIKCTTVGKKAGRSKHERIKEHGKYFPAPRLQLVSEHSLETATIPFGTTLSLLIGNFTGTPVVSREAIYIRLHPNNTNRNNGIEIPELWMSTITKHHKRSADLWGNDFSPEQCRIERHQSQPTTVIQMVERNQSSFSPDEDLDPKWLNRETNDNALYCSCTLKLQACTLLKKLAACNFLCQWKIVRYNFTLFCLHNRLVT